jgi:phosphonate transport system substrate-binding protein
MVDRRTFLKSTGTAGTIGIAGISGCLGIFGGGDRQPYVDGKIKFLMSPSEPQDQLLAQYTPIKNRLNSYIDAVDTAEMQYAQDYAATLTALDSGTADVAETGPFAAALGADGNEAEIVLQRYGYGAWTYSSVIITREDSDIETLEDLEGKDVAFADALSASGSLYPLSMIKEAGLSIPEEPGSPAGADFNPTWSTHGNAFEAVMSGSADAAGVGRFITVGDADDNGDGLRDYQDGVKEIERRGDIPRAPIVVSPELTSEEKETIKQAFIEAPDEVYLGEDGEEGTDDDLWFNDVREADQSTYQPVIDAANELGYGQDIFGSN